MIELYISSTVNLTPRDIIELLSTNNVECQVSQNCCSYKCEGQIMVEDGYYINLFELHAEEFKAKVWDVLQPALNLSCAFVRDEGKYMGCVNDWPCVFRPTECESRNVNICTI